MHPILTTIIALALAGFQASAGVIGGGAPVRVHPGMSRDASSSIDPLRISASAGEALFEGFEAAPSADDLSWLPEGWERQSNGDPALSSIQTWYNSPSTYQIAPLEGVRFEAVVACSDKYQDEWLVSPEITVGEGYELSFDSYFMPFFFYYTDSNHYDWTTDQWKSQEICQDFKVMIKSADDADFQLLHSFADQYMGTPYSDLMILDFGGKMQQFTFSLAAYEGKRVRIAFQYVGQDGNAVFVDAVRVGLPKAQPSYMPPFSALYYGLETGGNYGLAPQSIAVVPAFSPVTFSNTSAWLEGQAFEWIFPEGTVAESDDDEATVAYGAVCSGSAWLSTDNWHQAPTLAMTADGHAPASTTWDVRAVQAGGWAEYTFAGDTVVTSFGLVQANPNLDFDFATEYIDFGKPSAPIFGYDADTEAWWTDHYFQDMAEEGDYARVNAVINYLHPATSPLVLTGVQPLAYGRVDDDAEFTLEILRLNEGFEPEPEPIASAMIHGSDIPTRDPQMNTALVMPFVFDAPVVIDQSAPAYIVRLSGFRSDKVRYFAPYQSWKPSRDGLCLGFAEVEIATSEQQGFSYIPVANFANEYGEMYSAFCFNLIGWFPWFEPSAGKVELDAEGTAAVAVSSSCDPSEVQIDAPEWLRVSLSGRFGNAVVNIEAVGTGESEAAVRFRAPGIYKEITVAPYGSNAIGSVVADSDRQVEAVYTVGGVRVDAAALIPGVYVVRYTDGSASRVLVK